MARGGAATVAAVIALPDDATGGRLALAPLTVALAGHLLADPGAVPAAPGWPHDDTADALRLVVEGGATAWLVVETGLVVGEGGTAGPVDADGVVEIGYGLAASVRGRGLGSEAVRLIAGAALALPGVRAVRAHALLDNVPSRRALLRAGFSLDAVDGILARYALAAPAAAS